MLGDALPYQGVGVLETCQNTTWPPINPSCLELSDPRQIHIHVDNFLYLQPSNLNLHYGKWFAAWILNTEMAEYPGWLSSLGVGDL